MFKFNNEASNVLVKEINNSFKADVRNNRICQVLGMLGDLRQTVEPAEMKEVYKLCKQLVRWAQSDGHNAIATLLMRQNYDLIVAYGTREDKAMADGVTDVFKALPASEKKTYYFTEETYAQLATYENQLIKEIETNTVLMLGEVLTPSEQQKMHVWVNQMLLFINSIPIPYYYTAAKYVPLSGGPSRVIVQTSILKFSYLKVRLFEAAEELFISAGTAGRDKAMWSRQMAMIAADKFRASMQSLKDQLDRMVRHAKEDREQMVIYTNPGTIIVGQDFSTDKMTFAFASAYGYREKRFRDFEKVGLPEDRIVKTVHTDHVA